MLLADHMLPLGQLVDYGARWVHGECKAARESRMRPEKREFASVGGSVALLPGGKISRGNRAKKLRHRIAPAGASSASFMDEGVVEYGVSRHRQRLRRRKFARGRAQLIGRGTWGKRSHVYRDSAC